MKKTYFLLLLTLLFTFSATGATVCNQIVGGTNFQFKSESDGNSFEDLQTFGNDKFSALQYTLSSGSITIPGNLNRDGVFVHTVSGLPTTDTDYTIAVEYSTSGETEFRFNWDTHGKQEVIIQNQNGTSGTKNFTIKSKSGSLSWGIQECGGQKVPIVIKSITVTGCIEQKIVSENGNILCKGEENTFRAIGLGENVTWVFNGEELNNTNGSSYIGSFNENGLLKAIGGGITLEYKIWTTLCGGVNTDRQIIALETFKTPNTNPICKVEDLRRNVSTAYTYQSNKGAIAEEQYAIIKNTESTWPGWYKDNGAKIVYGNTQKNEHITDAILTQHNQTGAKNTDYDGFMIVNCNTNKYEPSNPSASKRALIVEYNVSGLCPNTYYDFSAFISNLDATEGHAGINVLFEVIEIDAVGNEINPSNPIFTKETGNIACGDQSWKEFGGSFINGNNTNVKLKLYNNNQTETPNFNGDIIGNDVAIDDITLSRIIPRINVYFNEALTSFTSSDACNNKNTEIKLYVGNHDYIINDLLPGGYYIVEQRVANSEGTWGAWAPVMTEPKALTTNAFEEVTATIKEGQGVTQYRAIVAPTAADVETVRANNNAQLPGCSTFNITKEDSYAQLTYQCTDIPTQITENESSSIEIQYIDNKIIVTGIDAQTQISVINIIGKTIYEDTTTENQYTIDLNPYHSGIYIVKIGNKVERIRKY